MSDQAKHLRVLITSNGIDQVNMTFPIFTLNILESLIPGFVLASLKLKNIELEKMIEKVKSSGFKPQIIFENNSGEKNYKVWIE